MIKSKVWREISELARDISEKQYILEHQDIEYPETIEWARDNIDNDIAGFRDYIANNT